jgi:hypothetical protein
MDTVTAFALRRTDTPVTTGTPDQRSLAVTATFQLSEHGRKASLLVGGNGHALQQLAMDVPVHRLHLVSVDAQGVARLKLRPRYELDAQQRVIRTDEIPTYDAPPSIEDLFRDAARNHQLERTYRTDREAAKVRRRDAGRERRTQVAQAFLADLTMRAVAHPVPTPTRCFINTPQGRVAFDASKDDGLVREVPIEAHRRFQADLRARRIKNQQDRATQLALHEQKRQFVAEWIATHGTPEQQARQMAGVLPMTEAIEAIADHAHGPLCTMQRYEHDGARRLQEALRASAEHGNATVDSKDVIVTTSEAKQVCAVHWELLNRIRAAVPNAAVTLRLHKVGWKHGRNVALAPFHTIVVTQRVGPLLLRREYLAPDS